jgi:hypothetical protein
MKLIHQSYVKNGAGEVKVVAEEGEQTDTFLLQLAVDGHCLIEL